MTTADSALALQRPAPVYRGLRRFNLIMGFLHLVQGVLMIVLSNATTYPIFSNFRVQSGSGLTYTVEVRDVRQRQLACDCVDFRINGLGTCKHVEAVLLHVQTRFRRLFEAARKSGSTRMEVVVDPIADTL